MARYIFDTGLMVPGSRSRCSSAAKFTLAAPFNLAEVGNIRLRLAGTTLVGVETHLTKMNPDSDRFNRGVDIDSREEQRLYPKDEIALRLSPKTTRSRSPTTTRFPAAPKPMVNRVLTSPHLW
jgi:hypothetical protein